MEGAGSVVELEVEVAVVGLAGLGDGEADEMAADEETAATLGEGVEDGLGDGERVAEDTGGSSSISSGWLSSSECRPTGLSGRRSVPLFASGSMPMESQMIL